MLVPAVAVVYSLHQQERYRASADVLINAQTAVQNIAGTSGLATQDPQRFLDTQAALAREPQVARQVVAQVGGLTVDELIRNSSVSEKQGANLLVFSVTDHRPAAAVELAAEYATQYVAFERKLDTGALQAALKNVRTRIASLGPNAKQSALYASLADKEQQLETTLTLQTSTASVVRTPDGAAKVEPRPIRAGALALVFGVIIGLALALLREALDSRIRNADGIASRLGLTMLARLPAPPRRLRNNNRLAMLDDPFGHYAEAVRKLRTNLEFANLHRHARTIMVTSGIEREGKSTTAANLAVAFARTGERVILVDLDLRRPFLHRFFDHESRPGITDVVLRQVGLDDALFQVPVGPGGAREPNTRDVASDVSDIGVDRRLPGLGILPAGQLPPNPGEFVGTHALAETLAELGEHADIVIIDSPPLLHVSDALTLSASVDAIVVVAKLDSARRNILSELSRVLATCQAPRLGFILTGAEHDEAYEYGYGGDYHLERSTDDSTFVPPQRSAGSS